MRKLSVFTSREFILLLEHTELYYNLQCRINPCLFYYYHCSSPKHLKQESKLLYLLGEKVKVQFSPQSMV